MYRYINVLFPPLSLLRNNFLYAMPRLAGAASLGDSKPDINTTSCDISVNDFDIQKQTPDNSANSLNLHQETLKSIVQQETCKSLISNSLSLPSAGELPNSEASNSEINQTQPKPALAFTLSHEGPTNVYRFDSVKLDPSNPFEFELQKLVALIVKSCPQAPGFSSDYLQEVTILASHFMKNFCDSLKKLTDIQRHSKAGISDLLLCLNRLNVTPNDLFKEYQRHKALPSKIRQQAAHLRIEVNRLIKGYNADKYDLEKNDPSLVFFTNEQYEIAALVPQQDNYRDYIPNYFPELPPDFTYRLTNNYMKTLTELKKIKMKLFEESRLNEASLYKLIDDDEKRWLEELDEQLRATSDDDSETNEDIMSIVDNHGSDIEMPSPDFVKPEKIPNSRDGNENVHSFSAETSFKQDTTNSLVSEPSKDKLVNGNTTSDHNDELQKVVGNGETSLKPILNADEKTFPNDAPKILQPESSPKKLNTFDILAYARKRKFALERPIREIAKRSDLRAKNYYLKAEKKFSCYAQEIPVWADYQELDSIIKHSFTNVIRATRMAEKTKQEKIALLAEERQRLEKENQVNTGTLEFAFNEADNFLDDSDDNANEDFQTLDFGDMSEPLQHILDQQQ